MSLLFPIERKPSETYRRKERGDEKSGRRGEKRRRGREKQQQEQNRKGDQER
jgi:hypothetical protein